MILNFVRHTIRQRLSHPILQIVTAERGHPTTGLKFVTILILPKTATETTVLINIFLFFLKRKIIQPLLAVKHQARPSLIIPLNPLGPEKKNND